MIVGVVLLFYVDNFIVFCIFGGVVGMIDVVFSFGNVISGFMKWLDICLMVDLLDVIVVIINELCQFFQI